MPPFSRRRLLRSGLALSASSLLMHSILGRAALAAATEPAPREKLLLDFGWKFQFGHGADPARDFGFGMSQSDFSKTGQFEAATVAYDDTGWRGLQLPHDWAVELPFVRDEVLNPHGFKPLGRRYPDTSIGWYRRRFDVPQSDRGRRIAIEFDGAFRSVLVWVNGCFIGRNDNGYVPFHFDVTDFLSYGGQNAIAVRVDASFGDGWFYEGAGLYRHVWLSKTDPLHLGRQDSTARATPKADAAAVELAALVVNEGGQAADARVSWKILDGEGRTVATASSAPQNIPADGSAPFAATAEVAKPALWAPDAPHLYSAAVTVESGGTLRDAETIRFGIRTAVFDADRGFLLNGRQLKIQGTCNHQDHAGVGAALPDRLQYFRIGVLKEMGSNAARTSHNMPTPEFVEACDRMGLMVACETRLMSSNPEGMAELEAMVKFYRNSPSVILWSIGNEEGALQDKEAEQGARIGAAMVRRCHELDPTRPVSAAVNGNNKQGVSDALDIIGFNYNLEFPDAFHKENPRRPVFGSETASAIATRGVYTTDKLRNTLSAYDKDPVPWGATAEEWWKFYATREWMAGGFAWTGFDYRGEPTPYLWPSVSSQFGIADTCGYPKDSFYYYQAWWGKEPVLHVFPHWNFLGREGEVIPVWVFSNLDEVELFHNGKSLGSQKVPRLGHLEWKVRYAPGAIEARGSKGGKPVLTERRETTGDPYAIRLTPDRAEIDADGEDLVMIKVEALDRQGRPVPTARNPIGFNVTGAGRLIGVGNGDPNCQESDKGRVRSLFSGLAQVIVQAGKEPGEIRIEAVKDGHDEPDLVSSSIVVRARKAPLRPAVA